MSTIEISSKVKELRELKRMLEELNAEIEAVQDGSGEMYTVGDFPTITGQTTFYAIWSLTSPETGKDPTEDKEQKPTLPSNQEKTQTGDSNDPTDPQTGDTSLMGLWITVMLVSAMGFAFCITKKKRVK